VPTVRVDANGGWSVPEDGYLPVGPAVPDPARLATLQAAGPRRDWWLRRIVECYPLLNQPMS
jgi:O-succinylbenzoate synthase